MFASFLILQFLSFTSVRALRTLRSRTHLLIIIIISIITFTHTNVVLDTNIILRYPPEDQTKKPGPGAHNPDYRTKSSPAFSMGVRHTEYLTPLIVDVPDV